MLILTYSVPVDAIEEELSWLFSMAVVPHHTRYYDWAKEMDREKFYVIVAPEAALAIKLRRNIDTQKPYNSR